MVSNIYEKQNKKKITKTLAMQIQQLLLII